MILMLSTSWFECWIDLVLARIGDRFAELREHQAHRHHHNLQPHRRQAAERFGLPTKVELRPSQRLIQMRRRASQSRGFTFLIKLFV